MERSAIGEAITILILIAIATVISTIIWKQMYDQASIASTKREYKILEINLIKTMYSNNTHTKVYSKISLMNTGNIPFKETNIRLLDKDQNILLDNITNTIITQANTLDHEEFIWIDNNLLDTELILNITAKATDNSTYGFMKKVKID